MKNKQYYDNSTRVFIQDQPTAFGVEIRFAKMDRGRASLSVAQPVDFLYKEKKEGAYSEPTMILSDDEVSSLYELFGAYLKRKNKLPIDGRQEDAERHLQDMRRIAFHKLKMDKPNG